MKKSTLLFLFSFPLALAAQNLVVNPGFEDTLQCPNGSGAFVNYVANWTKPSWGSADFFYMGCPVAPTDEPPRNGNGCSGIIVYDPANIREYMTGQLSSPLLAGVTYNVSFYVCLQSSCMKAINEIGAYLTPTQINNSNANPIILTPQIQGSTPYTSINGWQLVQGTFVANGGEQYIILGAFVPDSMLTFTNVSNVGWGDTYYFVDDVCVAPGQSTCAEITGVQENAELNSVSVVPNPAGENAQITFNNPSKSAFTLSVFNSQGQLVQSKSGITSGSVTVERDGLAEGLYFFRLESGRRALGGKFILK